MKKWKTRTQIEKRSPTFRLLYYWGKFLGINPLTLSNNNKLQFSYLSLFYGCSLGTIYCYISFRALMARFDYYLPTETPISRIANVIGIFCQFLEISLMWFLFAIRQNCIDCLLKSFTKAERISTKLGIPGEWDKNLKKFAIIVAANNFMYFASLSFSHTLLHYYPNYNDLVWIAFNVPRIASFNVEMLFLCSVLGVKQKFHQLNKNVRRLMCDDCSKANEMNPQQFLDSIRNLRGKTVLLPERIILVSQLHRQLRYVLNHTVEYFAPLILFGIGNYVSSIPMTVYTVYGNLKDFRWMTGMTAIFHFGCTSHWMLYSVFVLIALSIVCGSTTKEVSMQAFITKAPVIGCLKPWNVFSLEANNTGNMLHGMLSNCKNVEDIPEFAKFNVLSLDLLQNRVSISLFGLFELDNNFFFGIMATAATYFTIMLQL